MVDRVKNSTKVLQVQDSPLVQTIVQELVKLAFYQTLSSGKESYVVNPSKSTCQAELISSRSPPSRTTCEGIRLLIMLASGRKSRLLQALSRNWRSTETLGYNVLAHCMISSICVAVCTK